MNYIELVGFMTDFIAIQVVEATFIVLMVMMFTKIELKLKNIIPTILLCSIVGAVLLPFGNYDILDRVIYLTASGIIIGVINKVNSRKLLNILLNVFIIIVIMMAVEFITFIPFLYFLGSEVSVVHESVFIAVLCSIPLRVFEYIICYLTYIKIGGKHEEIDREN